MERARYLRRGSESERIIFFCGWFGEKSPTLLSFDSFPPTPHYSPVSSLSLNNHGFLHYRPRSPRLNRVLGRSPSHSFDCLYSSFSRSLPTRFPQVAGRSWSLLSCRHCRWKPFIYVRILLSLVGARPNGRTRLPRVPNLLYSPFPCLPYLALSNLVSRMVLLTPG